MVTQTELRKKRWERENKADEAGREVLTICQPFTHNRRVVKGSNREEMLNSNQDKSRFMYL
ncbi:conserved domain protein [Paraprevotella xylaniphila YIT 11841]|uniref:Conserved domain protein n=1 Tax=Paraprevotella xylaniphila YIT 11841 TaxID=762982 RepID=F3QPQ6_9BACT|nr:conserved domain protein [Paraprevotella xylaniphila YIT 11841]